MKKTVDTSISTTVSLFRGLYARVAEDLGIDPSYVSRIARGERRSEEVESALKREFTKALASIKMPSSKFKNHN
jgi:hypothetical protein